MRERIAIKPLFPERLDDYIAEDSSVRVIDVFTDDLDLSGLGFKPDTKATGRPRYHPATLLKLYVYGYLNRVQSSRRLEREAQRNVELMWLEYECPAGERLIWRFESEEKGLKIHHCWSSSGPKCSMRSQCTRSDYRASGGGSMRRYSRL